MSEAIEFGPLEWDPARRELQLQFTLAEEILFDLDLNVQFLAGDGQCRLSRHASEAGWNISWLPRGTYRVVARPEVNELPSGDYVLRFVFGSNVRSEAASHSVLEKDVHLAAAGDGGRWAISQDFWQLESLDGVDLSALSWRKGPSDWFHQHFDHAAEVVIDLMLARDDRLKGDILDVGCGDGVTDLGIFLRCNPNSLTGVDPFRGFERLPQIVSANQLPASVLDHPGLRFEAHSANDLPYPDDHFDVVLSWGSLEHIAGGYQEALGEIRRVLRPGGLFFVHPGLYYSTLGNHLQEFFDDPFIHLKITPDELRQKVLSSKPDYIDRAGYFAEPEEYWRWYTELNPITVPQIEKELRGLGFEPWRVALRTADVVEYTEELQAFGMDQLAIAEMYASFVLKPDQSSG